MSIYFMGWVEVKMLRVVTNNLGALQIRAEGDSYCVLDGNPDVSCGPGRQSRLTLWARGNPVCKVVDPVHAINCIYVM